MVQPSESPRIDAGPPGSTWAILTAAGSGTRLGRDIPKAFVEVAGVAMVVHAARRLAASGVVDAIVVTAPARLVAAMHDVVAGDPQVTVPVHVVAGGGTRQESVAAGLARTDDGADVVLVHDAARPFASSELVRRVVATVRAGHGAVVPGVPVVDTVKAVSAALHTPRTSGAVAEPVTSTPDRSVLRAVQTPQGFDRALLDRAHAAGAARGADSHATDDAGLVEALGEQVVVVPGEESALKITTERDLYLAGLYAGRPA